MLEISLHTFGDYISRVALVNYLSYRFLWMISQHCYLLSLGLCAPGLVQPGLGTIWLLMFWTDKSDVWMLASISVLISKATCLKIGNFLLHPNIPQIIYKTNSLLCALQIFMLSNFSLFIILFFSFFLAKMPLFSQLFGSGPWFSPLVFCPLLPVTYGVIVYHQVTVISLA